MVRGCGPYNHCKKSIDNTHLAVHSVHLVYPALRACMSLLLCLHTSVCVYACVRDLSRRKRNDNPLKLQRRLNQLQTAIPDLRARCAATSTRKMVQGNHPCPHKHPTSTPQAHRKHPKRSIIDSVGQDAVYLSNPQELISVFHQLATDIQSNLAFVSGKALLGAGAPPQSATDISHLPTPLVQPCRGSIWELWGCGAVMVSWCGETSGLPCGNF